MVLSLINLGNIILSVMKFSSSFSSKLLIVKGFLLLLPFLTLFGATKNILLVNLDQQGGPDIIFHKTDNSFEWFKNYQYSYQDWYSSSYRTYGAINPSVRFMSNATLNFLDVNFANELIKNLHSGNAFDSNFKYDENYQPILSRENLDRLTWFWSNDNNISNISGIEEVRNLQYILIEDSSVSDLSPLWNLKSLNSLNISWGGKVMSITGINALDDLEYLNLSGQKIKNISELTSLNKLKLVDLEENYLDLSDSSTKSTINQLRLNGVVVDVETQIPKSVQQLSTQMQSNLAKINATGDVKANFIYGFEMLLDLLENTEASSLKKVAINGGAAQSLINFTLPDLWSNDLDYENNSNLNDYADLDQLEGYFYDVFIPRLTVINSYFEKMSTHNSTIILDQSTTGQEEVVNVDNGDAYALMAVVEALKGLLQVISSYNWDYNLKKMEELEDNDLINLEALLDGSNSFGRLKSKNQLTNAKQSFKNAVSYYTSASDKMRTRLDQEMLFEMSSSDVADDDKLRSDLDEFVKALDDQHNLSDDIANNTDTIMLNSLFESKFDPVNSIPAVVGDKFESDEFPDPTFGGIMPNWTKDILEKKLLDAELIAKDALEGSTQIEGAPNWSQSNWLGAFYIPFKTNPSQFWMYHSNLDWVFFNSQTPSSIWFFFTKTGDWLWTKKSVYPYLFSNGLNNWLYLRSDGELLFWNNSSWEIMLF